VIVVVIVVVVDDHRDGHDHDYEDELRR